MLDLMSEISATETLPLFSKLDSPRDHTPKYHLYFPWGRVQITEQRLLNRTRELKYLTWVTNQEGTTLSLAIDRLLGMKPYVRGSMNRRKRRTLSKMLEEYSPKLF